MIEIKAPDGGGDRYRWYESETGARFKVLARVERVGDTPQFAAIVTTSQVDEGAHALRDGDAVVVDSLSHTFTEVEWSAPGFDPAERLDGIVAERVAMIERRHAARAGLAALTDAWGGFSARGEGK